MVIRACATPLQTIHSPLLEIRRNGKGDFKMAQTIQQIIENAKAEFLEQYNDAEYPEDIIAEIADSSVPVYYNHIAQVAADDISLILDEPELGAASGDNFKGMENTPVAYIAANIYERVQEALFELLYELQNQREAA